MSFLSKNDNYMIPSATNLVSAINAGDLSRVRYFIAVGADVNLPPPGHVLPPLSWAVECGHTQIVQALLNAGAEIRDSLIVDIRDFLIAQRLHLHSIDDYTGQEVYDILTLLVEAGIDIDFTFEEGETLLHKVIYDIDIPLVNFLLQLGADVNHRDIYGCTPLMSAIFLDDRSDNQIKIIIEILKILLKYGANLNLKDNQGKNVLVLAKEAFVHQKVIQFLIDAGATEE